MDHLGHTRIGIVHADSFISSFGEPVKTVFYACNSELSFDGSLSDGSALGNGMCASMGYQRLFTTCIFILYTVFCILILSELSELLQQFP
jgi:hypothetical protein